MKRDLKTLAATTLLTLLTLACTSALAQQMYKWVGPDGKVTYSDQPPPANGKPLTSRSLSSDLSSSDFPQVLADAVARNPVTLYTSATCKVCDDGRSLLKRSGIPFAEKTIKTNEDITKLQELSGDTLLPFLQIGGTKLQGYEATQWRSGLTAAGYPETNLLPKDYRYPAPEAAVPMTPPQLTAPPSVTDKPAEAKKAQGNNDFHF